MTNALTWPDPFAVEIVVNHNLIGATKALRHNWRIEVSPAMWDLIKHANTDELEKILQSIPVLDLDAIEEDQRLRMNIFKNWK